MKLRHIALSLAAASTIAAAAPSFAEDVVVVSPAPATVTPLNPPSTSDTTTVYVAPPDAVVVTPGTTYNSTTGLPNGSIVTEPGGMTPQERRDVSPNTIDRSTGAITMPGYMGPRDTKGQ